MISTIDIYEISGLPVILLQSISLFTSLISLGSSRKKSFFIMEILKKKSPLVWREILQVEAMIPSIS